MPGDSLNINNKAVAQNTYDAIVVGSGISGGWAAKELCEKGLKTLVLERGRNVEHVKDYTDTSKDPWELDHHGGLTKTVQNASPIQSKCYAFNEVSKKFFVNDVENPYNTGKTIRLGAGQAMLVAEALPGAGNATAGAMWILPPTAKTVTAQTGLSVTVILRPGTIT